MTLAIVDLAPNAVVSEHRQPDGCTAVDVFAPPRADWEKLERPDPFPPDWPG